MVVRRSQGKQNHLQSVMMFHIYKLCALNLNLRKERTLAKMRSVPGMGSAGRSARIVGKSGRTFSTTSSYMGAFAGEGLDMDEGVGDMRQKGVEARVKRRRGEREHCL